MPRDWGINRQNGWSKLLPNAIRANERYRLGPVLPRSILLQPVHVVLASSLARARRRRRRRTRPRNQIRPQKRGDRNKVRLRRVRNCARVRENQSVRQRALLPLPFFATLRIRDGSVLPRRKSRMFIRCSTMSAFAQQHPFSQMPSYLVEHSVCSNRSSVQRLLSKLGSFWIFTIVLIFLFFFLT